MDKFWQGWNTFLDWGALAIGFVMPGIIFFVCLYATVFLAMFIWAIYKRITS